MVWRVDTVTTGLPGGPFLTRLMFNDNVGTVDDAVGAVFGFWTDLEGLIDNACTMTIQPTVFTIDNVTGQITAAQTSSAADSLPGTNGASEAAYATQGLIQWRTGDYIGGRELRGRTFIPGVTATSVAAGRPSSTYQSTVTSAAANLIADPNSVFNIWSPTNGDARAVTSGVCWTEFAVLRSRRD